ncbi:MAG TPA: RluA family pseudouridine synthase [Cellvibrionaceae bacterium]
MIDIIYQDEHLIAVNKPTGVLSVPGLVSDDNLLDRVLKQFPNSRTVHRLDMSTSGLLLFAQSYPAQKALNQLFARGAIKKRYKALVAGIVQADAGEICLPLIADWPNRPRQKIDWQTGKTSHTFFRTLKRCEHSQSTLLDLFPITGRSHQLRVHCWGIGHPILGDHLYNMDESHLQTSRLMLHAEQISLHHPITAVPLTINCPEEFADIR